MIKGFEITKYLLTQKHTIFFLLSFFERVVQDFQSYINPVIHQRGPKQPCYEILPHSSLTEYKAKEEKYVHFTNAMNIKNRVAWAMWQEAIHGARDPCAVDQSHWFSLQG